MTPPSRRLTGPDHGATSWSIRPPFDLVAVPDRAVDRAVDRSVDPDVLDSPLDEPPAELAGDEVA